MNELHKGHRVSSLDTMREVLARLDSYVSETHLIPSPSSEDANLLEHTADNRVTNASAFHHSLVSLVHNSPDAVLLLCSGECISFNSAALKVFACEASQLESSTIGQILALGFDVNSDLRVKIEQQVIRAEGFEIELKSNSSSNPQWYEFESRAFDFENAGRPTACCFLTIRNGTESKSREHLLAREADFLRSVFNATPQPLSVKTAESKFLLVNDAFCEIHDIDRDEIIGNTIADFMEGDYSMEDDSCEPDIWRSANSSSKIEDFVDSVGVPFKLSTRRATFRDTESNDSYFVTCSRDVTLERNRQNRLNLLASVFQAAREAVVILDCNGLICEANPEFISTIGKAHAELLGTCLSNTIHCDSAIYTEIVNSAQAGKPWSGNVKLIRRNGQKVPSWLSISPSKNIDGETTNLIALFSDITQIEMKKLELRRQALHDHLTKLPNRRFFRKRVAEVIEADQAGSRRFSVSFLDLDDFKIVNDTLGHDAGDQLLVEVSKRLRETLDEDCFIARFGGDEFAILMIEKADGSLNSKAAAESVVEAISREFILDGQRVFIGVSIGTTVYPDHTDTVESLMRHADVAMYQAKEEGKNKVTFFSSELAEDLERRQSLLGELRTAIDCDELEVVYQPKLCLHENRINSCEALVRWTKRDGAIVSPSEFIPLAEDFGLIEKLGDRVFQIVARQAKLWHDGGVLTGPIAVNLSPRQLNDPNFISRLKQTLEVTDIQPEWIELEITENAVMEDKDRALRLMHEINELGMSIAIDDFGTGFSSLGYIRDFPIRTLKIDPSFVRDIPHCTRAVAIAKTILSLGHGLNLKVVAEGVETFEQIEFLRNHGCDMVQGFLVSRPMSHQGYVDFTSEG
ncbi:EAL domain-containing protein [Mariniblastus sp.]|nr:EAL domain-containing protein [Mariniblastus sp.]MDA7925452.1 EAL domain-containing protein [Mariniblastus sp.]MDB4380055.1 EAL domain-containing protein [Mariniblastus sp.]MDB4392026.1 EAL domain-containing protein [bacterium]